MYFPTDTQNLNIDASELTEVTRAIESVMDKTEFDDIVIGGDFNWDDSRDSGHSFLMRECVQRIGLKSVWDRFPVSYTHIHTDMKATSVLDHFLINERLLEYVEDAGVMHLGDNLSRHSPIMLKLRVGDIPARQLRAENPRPRHPAWYKATEDHMADYTALLREKLSSLECPDSILCNVPA